MDFLSAILTTLTAIFSCVAAIAAWYSATEDQRHLWKINRQKVDMILLPRSDYQCLPPARLSMDMNSTDSLKYFQNQPVLLEIDGKVYWGGDIDMLHYNPYGVREIFMVTKYFKIVYITKQGRKKWKKVRKSNNTES